MTLHPDWKNILKQAWSVRLLVAAGLLEGMQAVLPLFSYDLPRGLFSAATIIVTMAALAARVVAQRGMPR